MNPVDQPDPLADGNEQPPKKPSPGVSVSAYGDQPSQSIDLSGLRAEMQQLFRLQEEIAGTLRKVYEKLLAVAEQVTKTKATWSE